MLLLLFIYIATADFTEPTPFTVRFTSGTVVDGIMNVMIATMDNSIVEGDEDFTVSIASTSPTVTVGSSSSVSATIIDDDRKSEV